jgi:hypothetical protein
MKPTWNCPHCQMSSTRHWNVQRHIHRRHGGMGEPVRSDNRRYYKDMNSQNFPSPFAYSYQTSMSIPAQEKKSHNNFSNVLENQILVPLRKMVEYKNLLSQLSTIQRLQQQRTMLDGDGILYPSISSMAFHTEESNNNLSEEPSLDNENNSEIIGYRGHICENCSIVSIDTIFCHKDRESGQIETAHICNSKRLDDAQLKSNKDKTINNLNEKLPEVMKKKVNSWTQNSASLLAIEMPPNVAFNNCCEITPTNENHWAARAIKNRRTILNDDELSDFLHKVRNSTYAPFKFISKSSQEQRKESSTRHYLMMIADDKINLSFELLLQYMADLSR